MERKIGKLAALRTRCVVAIVCLAACLRAGAAEQWECRFLLSDRGVQFPEVRELLEDKQGRIWASSWGGGVARIHGTTWKTYTEADGLASNWVRGLALGEDGTVWISTPGGLCYFKDEKLHCLHSSALPSLVGDEPDLIFMTGAGDLLISSYRGALFRVRGVSEEAARLWEKSGQWETLIAHDESVAMRVSDFEEDASSRVNVAFKDDSWGVVDENLKARTPGPGGTMYLTRAAEGTSPVLWGSSAADADRAEIYTLGVGATPARHVLPAEVRGMATGQDGWNYVGTTGGLYRFTDTALERVDLGPQIGFPDVNEVYFSSDGSLWLGAREGLVRGAPRAWMHFPSTVEGHGLIALTKDPVKPGQLLAVDERFCLARQVGDSWTESVHLSAPEGLNGFATFVESPSIWAMGSTTLYEFNILDGGLIAGYPMPETGEDRKLFMTASGELWLAAMDGIVALVDGAWEERPQVPGYVRRTANAVYESAPGEFYVGVKDGIEHWAGGQVTYYGASAGIAEDDATYTICPAPDGTLWFGTYGSGVYVYDGTTFKQYDDTRGLAHHSVSNILAASDDTMWLSYRRVGIASYRDARWLNFGYENGLTNSPIRQMLEDEAGHLWLVTGREGLYRYRPDRDVPETNIIAATESVPYQGIGVFSFRATDAWQRTPPHVLLYSWRILDRNGETEIVPWNNFTSETSYITGALAPGTYTFEVRASDDARNVDPTPAVVSFIVAEPLWREPRIMLPGAILVTLLAIALILRMRGHRALRHSKAALVQSNQQLMNEIKERLQAEQRLNDHFEQLEELVRGRTSELEAAQRALVEQERLATLGKVTASVSHELRNPLGTLRSTLFLIARKVQGHDLGLEDALARGERSIQRCDRIIEEFLDFTRTVAMERESVAMDAWLKDLLNEITIPEGIHCDYSLESNVNLDVDPERLRRAVVNVVNNALQAMNEHGGEFKRLRVKSRLRGGRFEIVVKDNGPGMSEENLPRIFEPLYSTKGFGVGLGVPIVKDIMVKHQGGVEYHSVLGQGTTVVLWIPRVLPEAGPEA